MPATVTPAEARRRLEAFGAKYVPRGIRTGLGKGTRKAMARAENEVVSRGVGRGIWGGRKKLSWKKYMQTYKGGVSGKRRRGKFFAPGIVPLIVGASKVRTHGDVHRGGLQVVGLAANIELGRPTKPHMIPMPSGRTIRHPGSRVPRNPILPARASRAPGLVGPAVDAELVRAAQKAGLA